MTGGAATITASAATLDTPKIFGVEYKDVSAVDVVGASAVSATGSGTTLTSPYIGAISADGDLIVAVMSAAAGGIAAGTGYTADVTSASGVFMIESKVQGAREIVRATATGTSGNWLATIMSFKPTNGPTTFTTCGHTTIEATSEGGWTGYQLAGAQCIPGSNVTVVDCHVFVVNTAGAGAQDCAIWDSNGTYAGSMGEAGTLICHSGATVTPPADGWNIVSMTGCGTLTSGHTYWVGPYLVSGGQSYVKSAVSLSHYLSVGGGGPITWTTAGTSDGTFSTYLDVVQ